MVLFFNNGGSYGGNIGSITSSCTAENACYHGGSYGGVIGSITQSCTYDGSCQDLGRGRGKVGHVTNSCKQVDSCQDAGSKRGSIGSITQSCNAANACDGAGSGSSGAITSSLTNCCSAQVVGGDCEGKTQATLPTTCQAPPTPMPTTPKPTASKVREVIYDACNTEFNSYFLSCFHPL